MDGECAESVWNTFISIWVTVYVGFPNVLTHDFGSCFISEFFKNNCIEFGIIPKEIPCESHNSMSVGERYYSPQRRIYKKLKIEYPNLDNPTTLALAVRGLNNTANPEGLIPALLGFLGNIESLAPTQRERFAAMEAARKEMEKIVTKQRIALDNKNRTKTMDALIVLPGSEVLMRREKSNDWMGPYKLYKYDDYKTACIDMGKGIEPFSLYNAKLFSITAVKPYLRESTGNLQPLPNEPRIGDRVEVYWPLDKSYYPGTITS